MRKLLIALVCILIIVFSISVIDKLLNPKITFKLEKTTTKSFKEYSLFNYGDNFKTYVVSNGDKFDYLIDGVNITYDNKSLSINDYIIEDVDGIYDYFSIYDDSLIVLGYYKDNINYIINYNYNLKSEEILSNYNDMVIDFKSGLIFEETGYIVNYTYIKDNKYIKSNQNVCDIKKNDLIVNRGVEYYYDSNEKFIKSTEVLYSSDLYAYIKKNKICK